MYTRIKKINNIEYAYLVKSYWSKRKKAPKQKTIKYLGRVHKFSRVKNTSLEQYLKLKNIQNYFSKNTTQKIIKDMIKLELFNHNFKEVKHNIWKQKNVIIDLKTKKIYNILNKKPVCIEINNNLLSTKTIRNVISPTIPPGLTNIQIYKYLANSFLSAGITLPKDKFIIISKKILNKVNNLKPS